MWVILVGQALLRDRRHRVAATDDDRRAGVGPLGEDPRDGACVPCANDGISNTPSGPFQNTVFASASASTMQVLAGLAEVDDVPRGRDLLGLERLVLGAAGDLLGDDDVDRQDDPDAVASRPSARIRRASSTRSGSARLLPTALPWASRNVLAIPPPRTSRSTLVSRLSMTLILSETLAPPRIAANGRSGASRSFESISISRSMSSPA